MNKEEAKQAAIEWLVSETRTCLNNPDYTEFNVSYVISDSHKCINARIAVCKTANTINKSFPFYEIKAPPKNTRCLARDCVDEDWDVIESSGELDDRRLLDLNNCHWRYWQVLKPVNSPYNNTGENNE